ncbi:MAG TPA: hypothetical protein VF310_10465 [Vicinamibacteria bacterium]
MASNAEGRVHPEHGNAEASTGGSSYGPAEPLLAVDKQGALEDVLQSATFLRAEQLRSFLRYICEMEQAGRAAELSEYLIGVEALGRPPGYSTAADSSVRRRAHALRQKLEEVYAGELAGGRLRIHLPKGSYVPRFARTPAPSLPEPALRRTADGAATEGALTPTAPVAQRPRAAWLAATFAVGAFISTAAFWRPASVIARPDPVVAEAWAPFARPGGELLICLSTSPHIGILPYPEGPLPPKVVPTDDAELRGWYRRHFPLQPEERLATHRTRGPVRLGDVMGLVSAVRTLDRLGADFQVVPEQTATLPTLRGRDVLVLGNPEYSYAAARLLERGAWTVAYDPASRERVVRPRLADSGLKAYVPARDTDAELTEAFGLITVLPSEGVEGPVPHGTLAVSCTNSAGCQAALEFFASPARLRALRERFKAEKQAGFPPAYQVVVRCRVHGSQALSGEYEAHALLPAS